MRLVRMIHNGLSGRKEGIYSTCGIHIHKFVANSVEPCVRADQDRLYCLHKHKNTCTDINLPINSSNGIPICKKGISQLHVSHFRKQKNANLGKKVLNRTR